MPSFNRVVELWSVTEVSTPVISTNPKNPSAHKAPKTVPRADKKIPRLVVKCTTVYVESKYKIRLLYSSRCHNKKPRTLNIPLFNRVVERERDNHLGF
jgi:hypothetical protein